MTEGTSGAAPGSTLRGVESGATLTKGPHILCAFLSDEALTTLRHDELASGTGNGTRATAGSSIRRHYELAT